MDVENEELFNLRVVYRDDTLELTLAQDSTISDLAAECAQRIEADVTKVSLFIMPKPGFQKSPFSDRKLTEIITPNTRIKLVGTPTKDVALLEQQVADAKRRQTARRNPVGRPSRTFDWARSRDEAMYTFHSIEPLRYLPAPEKSLRFLQRLANDPGIKASMRKHKFSVGLLTEMNPAEHTTHESKTLGLNRNRGEVIELRLRTDRYDGYRDYKVIRKTLCHELSHNVWGEHDRNFWDLTKQIEQEVERNDFLHGGHRLTDQEFYDPTDTGEDVEHDHGGWVGGEFVLGRAEGAESSSNAGLSRRELMARAAMARYQNFKDKEAATEQDEKDDAATK